MCDPPKRQTKTNWSRHLKVVHPEEVEKAHQSQVEPESKQMKIDFPVVQSSTKPCRLLALYAATTTMPVSHVENEYFKVSCASWKHHKKF